MDDTRAERRLRILLISGVSIGGAARSTHELAALFASRGHAVAVIMRNENAPRREYVHRRLVNLGVKVARQRSLARVVERVTRLMGRRLETVPAMGDYGAWQAVRPENALPRALHAHRPDVVVANSIDLMAWRQLRADCARLGMPVVLYVREEAAILHLSHSQVAPDRMVANATGHADALRELGYEVPVAPSIVEPKRCFVESTRQRVVLVNPIHMYGIDVALFMARARPDIPFTFFESWPLDDAERAALDAEIAHCPNVELRSFVADPRDVFADARILLAPYRYPGRSRVVAEAQISGIPALACDLYGVAEAVGPGGIVLDPDGDPQLWVAALARLWDDQAEYDHFAAAALEHSRRIDMQPDHIARTIEAVLVELVDAFAEDGVEPAVP